MKTLENCTIAVQNKGRLTEKSIRWLNETAGTGFDEVQKPFDATREVYDEETGVRLFGCSNGDLLQVVSAGLADYGIGGSDKFYERLLSGQAEGDDKDGQLYKLANLGFASCRLVLATRAAEPDRPIARVATTYPQLARRYFEENIGTCEAVCSEDPRLDGAQRAIREVRFDRYSGGIESIGRRGNYDAVVDVCETGKSLQDNGWQTRAVIMECQAVLFTGATPPVAEREGIS